MAEINIEVKDYVNAKDGSLLIKKNGKWQVTTFEELNRANDKKLNELDNVSRDVEALKKNAKHFVVYAKSHFMVVYNYFKIKILAGEIDVLDEEILRLDEKVLNGEISVKDALEKHEFLKHNYELLYLNDKELKEFHEV